MAEVTITTRVQVGPLQWRLGWSATAPGATYRVYLDGRPYTTTQALEVEITVSPGESAVVEVFDDASDAPAATLAPNRVLLWWAAVPDAAEYRIERRQGAEWAMEATVRGVEWLSPPYPTGTTAFRVTAVDIAGVTSERWEQELFILRRPSAPEGVGVTIADGVVTVIAGSS